MKKLNLLGLVLSFSVVGSTTLPALAQYSVPSNQQMSNQGMTQPQSAMAIVVGFAEPVVFDVGQNQTAPITLYLAEPIQDGAGNVVVPAGSPVEAYLVPHESGAFIVAQSLVVNGQVVPIQASSDFLEGKTVTVRRGTDKAQVWGPMLARIAHGVVAPLSNGDINEVYQYAALADGVANLAGAFSTEKARVVEIPQGTTYVLRLQTTPSSATTAPPQTETQPVQGNVGNRGQQSRFNLLNLVETILQIVPRF